MEDVASLPIRVRLEMLRTGQTSLKEPAVGRKRPRVAEAAAPERESDDDERDSEAQADATEHAKRSKNRPLEQSSRKTVSRRKEVVAVRKKESRDPRFDNASGVLNYDLFRKSYAFLEGNQADEIKALKKEMKKTRSRARREEIQQTLRNMQQEKAERERGDRIRAKLAEKKREIRKRVQQGGKTFYLKRSEQRRIELDDKFETLRKSGKLQSYLAKKRKRNASKDHKSMPYRRRAEAVE